MQFIKSLTTILSHPNNVHKKMYSIFLILWWKINQLFFKIPAVITLVDDVRIVCYPFSSYGSFVVYSRFPEYYEMQFFHSLVEENDTVIDVGANIGAVTLLAAHKLKKGKVYSFEPTPELLIHLRENMNLNNYSKKVIIEPIAVSDQIGSCTFVTGAQSEVNHLLVKNDNKQKSITVPTTTLDYYCSTHKLNTIQVLKVDVEGAEPLVIKGAKKLFTNGAIDIMLFELNLHMSNFATTPQMLFSSIGDKYFIFEFDSNGMLSLIPRSKTFTTTVNLVAVKKDVRVIRKVLPYLSYVRNT